MKYYLYCDESCHLLKDRNNCMILGCCWAPKEMIPVIKSNIKNIKQRNNIAPNGELKWTKISKGNISVYEEIIDYFFDNDQLHFRGIVIPDKSSLHHEDFKQSHDEWYYKMMYQLILPIVEENGEYSIFLDYKDIYGGQRSNKLKDVLSNKHLDWGRPVIAQIQCLPSHENQMIQLADIFSGALSYVHRGLISNEGKNIIVNKIKNRSYCSLLSSTPLNAKKFNLFVWHGQQRGF